MSYNFYKIVHVVGLMLLFSSLGGMALNNLVATSDDMNARQRKWLSMVHGLALVIILVGGFGLLARLGVSHGTSWPLWAYFKVGLWLFFGASMVLFKRMKGASKPLFFILPVVGGFAAYLATYKPF